MTGLWRSPEINFLDTGDASASAESKFILSLQRRAYVGYVGTIEVNETFRTKSRLLENNVGSRQNP